MAVFLFLGDDAREAVKDTGLQVKAKTWTAD